VPELVKSFNTFKKTNKIDYLTVYTKNPHFHDELKKITLILSMGSTQGRENETF
jgi:hypothetical protein